MSDAPKPCSPGSAGPIAWMVERQCDPTFPRLFMSHADAAALLNYCNVSPLPTIRPLYLDAAQRPVGCDIGFMTVEEWPKEIDERVLLYVVHQSAQYEPDAAKRESDWEGWCVGHWTDFNGGGWTWHGMIGTITHVAPLLPRPTSQLPSTSLGSAAK